MKATALLVKNVLGIEEMRIEPGQITKISGANGSGKSSVLAALQLALGGGNLMNLRRVGTDEDPEVVLVLDDGRYRIERKGDETVVKQRVGETAAYEKIRRPQQWLDQLFDPYGSNPLTFLNARPMDRADILLKVLPLELDRTKLLAAIGEAWPAGQELPDAHPLQVLARAREVLFDERTGVNRSQRDKESSAYELQKALPAEMPDDPAAALKEAQAGRDALFTKLSDRRAAAETAEQQAQAAAQAVYDEATALIGGVFKTTAAKLRHQLDLDIAELRKKADDAIAAEKAEGEKALGAAEDTLVTAIAAAAEARRTAFALVEDLQPQLQTAEQRVAELIAQSKNVASFQRTKELADQHQQESDSLKAVAQKLTEAIDAVDVFKAQLLKDLPIAGLEIRGKEIFVGGIPFDQINTAGRIHIAVTVAALRAKTQALPCVFVDGAEALDKEQYQTLEAELLASGVQAFIARVEDTPLAVASQDGPPQKVTRMPARPARRGSANLVE